MNAEFGRRLILDSLVESYPGIGNGAGEEGVVPDFVEYLSGRVDFSRDQIGGQVHRLLSMGCLEARAGNPGGRIVWT